MRDNLTAVLVALIIGAALTLMSLYETAMRHVQDYVWHALLH